ncbi:MAG: hypothetical protein WCY09_08900, partial [Candidatus Omnitrophota bacterium]
KDEMKRIVFDANYFTTTLLPMHITLNKSGLYKRVCGDWQVGDGVSYRGLKTIVSGITGQHVGLELGVSVNAQRIWFNNNDAELIRIPRTIDDSGRDLWGMVDWKLFTQEMADDEGNINIYENPYIHLDGHDAPIGSGPPTEAILKALCAQENIVLDK